MEWFYSLLFEDGIAHTILLYALIISAGVALSKIKIFGISLGVTFVLFVGLFIGHLGFEVNHGIIHFIREFGLILFIFSIGLQVGPGFFSSFKKGGIKKNLYRQLLLAYLSSNEFLLFTKIKNFPSY